MASIRISKALVALLGLATLLGGIQACRPTYSARVLDKAYYGLSRARTSNGRSIDPQKLGGSDYCGNCHRQIFHEWSSSLHHFSSFNNPVYRKAALEVAQNRGDETLKFCASCHDPVALFAGEIPAKRLNEWSMNAGITCLACHRISAIHGSNGHYQISPPTLNASTLTDHPWLQPLHRAGVALAPGLHKQALSKPFYATAKYCQTCHTVTSLKALNGHRDLPIQHEEDSNCLDCHMPKVASQDPAAKKGLIRSHRFTGGNTAVPAWNRDDRQFKAATDFLSREKIVLRRLAIERADRKFNLHYEVWNAGVGHGFPAGVTDSNQAWVEIRVKDARGAMLFENTETRFSTEFVDRLGFATNRRNTATEAVAIRSNTVLAPNEIRPLHYEFSAPKNAVYPLTATVEVRWRKYSDSLLHWLRPEGQAPEAPTTVLASNVTTLNDVPPWRP